MAEAAPTPISATSTGDDLAALRHEIATAVAAAAALPDLEEIRVAALGKKGRITELMKTLGSLPPEARKERGAALNVVKDEIAAAIDARQKNLATAALGEKLARESIDVTLPARPRIPRTAPSEGSRSPHFANHRGNRHPVRQHGFFGRQRAGYRKRIL